MPLFEILQTSTIYRNKKKKKKKKNVGGIGSISKVNIRIQAASVYILGITIRMKRIPTNIQPPKRSSSLVTRITRPIIENQSQRTISPSSSFSSSILTKGMSERISPQSPPQKSDHHSSKSNRHRTIDFPRRRTVPNTTEHKSNKENFLLKNREKPSQDIYQFPPPLSSNHKTEVHIPSSKHIASKKYFFHPNPKKIDEDLLNNSYGLTLLNHRPKHSTATVLMISQVPNHISSQKQSHPRTSLPQQQQTLNSLEDLLCDREVESYFYPTSSQSERIYMNLNNPSALLYTHGTLC